LILYFKFKALCVPYIIYTDKQNKCNIYVALRIPYIIYMDKKQRMFSFPMKYIF